MRVRRSQSLHSQKQNTHERGEKRRKSCCSALRRTRQECKWEYSSYICDRSNNNNTFGQHTVRLWCRCASIDHASSHSLCTIASVVCDYSERVCVVSLAFRSSSSSTGIIALFRRRCFPYQGSCAPLMIKWKAGDRTRRVETNTFFGRMHSIPRITDYYRRR